MTYPTNDRLNYWYDLWCDGASKNEIERKFLDDPKSHGKAITKLWRDRLGIETEGQHPMKVKIAQLEAQVATLEKFCKEAFTAGLQQGAKWNGHYDQGFHDAFDQFLKEMQDEG